MKLDEAIKSWTSRAGVIRVRNVLNPLLWLCGLITPSSWAAVYFLREEPVIKYFLLASGAVPILATLISYFIWMFRDPDRLQSEEFVLRQQELTIYRRSEEGGARPLETDKTMLPNVAEIELQQGVGEGEPS
jgi:hypothetical protein